MSPQRRKSAARFPGQPPASEAELDTFLDLSQEPFALLDPEGRFLRLNAAWPARLGYHEPELLGRSFLELVDPASRVQAERWLAAAAVASTPRSTTLSCRHGRGDLLPCVCRARATAGTSQLVVVVRPEAEPGEEALRDGLTQLVERAGFMSQLRRVFEHTRERDTAGSFAVLLVDLDQFKLVNDRYGHSIGDGLLISVARRLEASLRPGDLVARFGGDEFAILLQRLQDEEDALVIAERIQRKLQAPILVEGHELIMSASLGVVLNQASYSDPEHLLSDADAAMYRAKARGRGCFAVFDADLRQSTQERLQLGTEVVCALEKEQLRVYYQPRIDLRSGGICGFEALLRWQHPRHGLLHPGTFLEMMADLGQLVAVERWLIGEACRQLQEWNVGRRRPLSLGVNLCAREFHQAQLAEFLRHTLAAFDLTVDQLHLEVTEDVLLEVMSDSFHELRALEELGAVVYVDDFGAGSSSLTALHRFPVRGLKIDTSFTRRLPADSQAVAIVRSLLGLGQSLDLAVVAEGIETPEQLALLRELGCPFAEGRLFSAPLIAEELGALLQQDPHW